VWQQNKDTKVRSKEGTSLGGTTAGNRMCDKANRGHMHMLSLQPAARGGKQGQGAWFSRLAADVTQMWLAKMKPRRAKHVKVFAE